MQEVHKPFQHILILLLVAMTTRGEEVRISRALAVELAFENNPELAVAGVTVARREAEARWAGRLENPELELSYNNDFIGEGEGESVLELAFAQRFPITARLKKEKQLRAEQILLANAEIAEARRELAGQVDGAVIELLITRSLLVQQRELLKINTQIVGFLDEQVAQGLFSKLDAAQAKLTGLKQEQQISALEAQEITQAALVKQLVGLEPDTTLLIDEGLELPGSSPDRRVANEDVFKRRPDLILALTKIDEADAAVALEEAKKWEDISVQIFGEREEHDDEPNGLVNNTLIGLGVSIPLPFRNRNQAGIEQAHLDRIEAKKTVASARFQIRSQYDEAFRHRLAAWQFAKEASGEILSLAAENFKEYEKAYREGQASFVQVQQAQQLLLEIQTNALEAIAEYYRSDARLKHVAGDYSDLFAEHESPK